MKGVKTQNSSVVDSDYPTRTLVINDDGSINVNIISNLKAEIVTDKSFDPDGTSQLIIAANTDRKDYRIECPSDVSLNPNGYSLFIDLGVAASYSGTSFEVLPGGYFPPMGMALYSGNIYCKADASIVKASAKEFT